MSALLRAQRRVERTLSLLAGGIAWLVATVPLAIYLSFIRHDLDAHLEHDAQVLAAAANAFIAQQPDYWALQTDYLEARLARLTTDGFAYRLLDATGGSVLAIGDVDPALARRFAYPLYSFGEAVGRVELTADLRPWLAPVLTLEAVCLLLAWLVGGPLRRMPLARLRQAEQLAEQSRSYERALVDNFPFAVWIADANHCLRVANRAFHRMFHFGRDQARPGVSLAALAASADANGAARVLLPASAANAGGEVAVVEDGQTRWFETGFWPVTNVGGSYLGAVGFAREITARKTAEAELARYRERLEELVESRTRALTGALADAERAGAAKNEFLSRMSHELRTPLNAILGFGQLLEMDGESLEPGQRDNVTEIVAAGRHLLALVNEVLDLARVESGRIELHPEPTDLAAVVRACLAQVRPLAEKRRLHLRLALPERATVLADPVRVRQVVTNLLSNAIKYNREGGRFEVDVERQADAWRCAVIDGGHGLNAEQIARLFRAFERIGPAHAGIEGTGIGLALIKRLVAAMGGEVGVDSEIEVGSRFWFTLPAADDEGGRLSAGETPSDGADDRGAGTRVTGD